MTIYNEIIIRGTAVGNSYLANTSTNSKDQVLLRKLIFVTSSRNSPKFIETEFQ
jgi:hypothetical protein